MPTPDDPASSPVMLALGTSDFATWTAVVGSLPADHGAPVVAVLTGDAARRTALHFHLERATQMPVVAASGRVHLDKNVLYVVAEAERETLNFRRDASLLSVTPAAAPTTIDAALSAAALAFGEGTIAVLGVRTAEGLGGMRSVKEAGGTIVLHGSSVREAPLSLATNLVDIVADPGEVGPLVQQLIGRDLPVARSEEQVLRSFLEQVRAHTGVDFNA